MLTDQDIAKLTAYLRVALREDFVTKQEFFELSDKVNNLIINVDNYTRTANKYYQEMLILSHRVSKLERKSGSE